MRQEVKVMVVLTAEMKTLIKAGLCMVATAGKEGYPNIGPKGSVMVLDDSTLAFGELVGGRTYANLKENPKAAIAVVDPETRVGYRFVGTVQLETEGSLYDKFAERFEKMKLPRPVAAVKVALEAIYDVSVKNAGKKIG
ncbi:MAG: pyridoxamine 5'-phosphate oxidase family protein [Syntrophobacterales bacterium]|nr:pyridoxamine 5'-phosphate oxidase family protein [Syntrophobacterales bacterium]